MRRAGRGAGGPGRSTPSGSYRPASTVPGRARGPRILIAPLNWGLGHAARCLPIAGALAGRGADVHWASDGAALALLRTERPDDIHHELPGYGVRHASASAIANGLRRLPGMLKGILGERVAVAALHRTHAYDLILSDHRYGCRVPGVPSVLLCHQVHLPLGSPLVAWAPDALHRALVRRFDELAVPDWPPPRGLAGAMSRPLAGVPTRYLGPVSRFRKPPTANGDPAATTWASELACVLSGPEPARSGFEALLLRQLADGEMSFLAAVRERLRGFAVAHDVIVVRGRPRGGLDPNAALVAKAREAGVTVYDFLPSVPLRAVLANARALVTRPGYTSVMDLAALGRPAVFVPTPGQPEQAVLAGAIAVTGRGVAVAQEGFDLVEALDRLSELPSDRRGGDAFGGDLLGSWAGDIAARFQRR